VAGHLRTTEETAAGLDAWPPCGLEHRCLRIPDGWTSRRPQAARWQKKLHRRQGAGSSRGLRPPWQSCERSAMWRRRSRCCVTSSATCWSLVSGSVPVAADIGDQWV